MKVKQQNLTIFVCFRGWTFYLFLFENLMQSRNGKFLAKNKREIIFPQLPSSFLPSSFLKVPLIFNFESKLNGQQCKHTIFSYQIMWSTARTENLSAVACFHFSQGYILKLPVKLWHQLWNYLGFLAAALFKNNYTFIVLLFSTFKHRNKLNPLRAKWPMEPALISSFCTFKRWESLTPSWTGH